uniref:Uncharacterized protein n=1 Tax=Peronospora matthiolae TaxID=2874970 RepID=A0AAV1TAD0_9STRA
MLSSSTSAALLLSTTVPSSPFVRTSTTALQGPLMSIELTRQRQNELDCSSNDLQTAGPHYHSALPVFIKTLAPCGTTESRHGLGVRSPSSPSSFALQLEMTKSSLTPLIEAAEQVLPSSDQTTLPQYVHSSTLKRSLPLTLPPIMQAIRGCPLGAPRASKRSRADSNDGLDEQVIYPLLDYVPIRSTICFSVPQQLARNLPHEQDHEHNVINHVSNIRTHPLNGVETRSQDALGPPRISNSVWEVVLATNMFPTSICLEENRRVSIVSPTGQGTVNLSSENFVDSATNRAVKQSHHFVKEQECGAAPFRTAKEEKAVLPPYVPIQTPANDDSQCTTTRIDEKHCSLHSIGRGPLDQKHKLVIPRDMPFNPLSLRSIMDNKSTSSSCCDVSDMSKTSAGSFLARTGREDRKPIKPTQRVPKRSDYSQHDLVRSGRWSVEEETYAKAMIEAFKSGILPLHGNTSLRKFLSEVLVCHPMRISKKFVGYVRKYHWYRITAGKCDPKVKRQALYKLRSLERNFWMSQKQNSERPSGH